MSMVDWNQNNIIKLQIDHTKIDEDLTDFPVLVNLRGSGSGINNTTMSGVFNELAYTGGFDDTFSGSNGASPNNLLWTTDATILNNKLRLSADAADDSQNCLANFKFTGDLDVEVWCDLSVSLTNRWDVYLKLHGTAFDYIVERQYNAGSNVVFGQDTSDYIKIGQTTTTATTVGLRMVRVSGSITYYWNNNGAGWTSLGTDPTTYSGDLYPSLQVYVRDSLPLTIGDYYNFKVNSGEVVWRNGFEPNRKKLAFVYPSVQEYQTYEHDENTLVLLNPNINYGTTTFVDDSIYKRTFAVTGGAVNSTAQFKMGNSSLYIPNSNSYLTITNSTGMASFGYGDFTVDSWVYVNGTSYGHMFMIDSQTSGHTFKFYEPVAGTIRWYYYNVTFGSSGAYIPNVDHAAQTWVHIAFIRFNGNLYIYVNGILQGSCDMSTVNIVCSTAAYIGRPNASEYTDAYFDRFRVSDIARWTTSSGTMPSSFDPGDAPYEGTIPKTVTYLHNTNEQLYCEIERWDQVNKDAQLWVKVPKVLANQPTDLLMYYDKNHVDNTDYVGDIGDFAGTQVWTNNYGGVWHLSQVESNTLLDSTGYAGEGSVYNATVVDGPFGGKAAAFDGSSTYIRVPHSTGQELPGPMSMSAFFKHTGTAGVYYDKLLSKPASTGWASPYFRYVLGTSHASTIGPLMAVQINTNELYPTAERATGIWYDYTGVYDLVNQNLYENGEIVATSAYTTPITNSIMDLTIGCRSYDSLDEYVLGDCTFIALYSTGVSSSWINAFNQNHRDNLVTYTGADIYQVTGYVKEQDTPVQRTLYIYDRTSGELMGKTQSNPSTGYYSVTTTASGMHHIVALDDVTDIYDYNDLIVSKVYPTKVI